MFEYLAQHVRSIPAEKTSQSQSSPEKCNFLPQTAQKLYHLIKLWPARIKFENKSLQKTST